jgi:hypothetical protein
MRSETFRQIEREFDLEMAILVTKMAGVSSGVKIKKKDFTCPGKYQERITNKIKRIHGYSERVEEAMAIYLAIYYYEIDYVLWVVGNPPRRTIRQIIIQEINREEERK